MLKIQKSYFRSVNQNKRSTQHLNKCFIAKHFSMICNSFFSSQPTPVYQVQGGFYIDYKHCCSFFFCSSERFWYLSLAFCTFFVFWMIFSWWIVHHVIYQNIIYQNKKCIKKHQTILRILNTKTTLDLKKSENGSKILDWLVSFISCKC